MLSTCEGVLWWFWEKSYRGSPPQLLLRQLKEWIESIDVEDDKLKERILTEVILWSFDNLPSLRTKSVWRGTTYKNEPIPQIIHNMVRLLFEVGCRNIPRVLEKSAFVLTKKKDDSLSLEGLFGIIESALKHIRPETPGDVVLSIMYGLYLIIIRARRSGHLHKIENKFKPQIERLAFSGERWQGYFKNLYFFIFSESSDNEFITALRRLCQERYRPKHSAILNEETLEYLHADDATERYGYLYDTLSMVNKSLSIVFKLNSETDYQLSQDIKIIRLFSQDVYELLGHGIQEDEKDKFLSLLQQIHYRLCDDYRLGGCIDYHNPLVVDIMNELKIYDKSEPDRKEGIGRVICKLNIDSNTSIFGDSSLLKDTIRNHTYDVIEKHGRDDSIIKVFVTETNNRIIFNINNNIMDKAAATKLIVKGHTFNMENNLWTTYNGRIKLPQDTNRKGYKSELILDFEKGLRKN